MNIRQDIAERLRAGTPQAYICRELRVSPITVQRTREALGLPAPKAGPPTPGSYQAAFHQHAEPLDDGHVRWTGSFNNTGTPRVFHAQQPRSACRVAFELRYGREPVGQVRPTCDMPGCIAGDHLADQPMRERDRAAYAAIFGGAA